MGQGQNDWAGFGSRTRVIAINGEAIELTSNRIEFNAARQESRFIVIAGDKRQAVYAVAGVDREQRIERAACRSMTTVPLVGACQVYQTEAPPAFP